MVLLWASFLLLPCAIEQIVGELYQKDVNIYPLTMYGCDDAENILQMNLNLRNKNDQGQKVLDALLDLEEDITEQWEVFIKVDQWNNGDWDEHFYDMRGSLCGMVQQFMSKVWKNLREKFSPALSGDCNVAAEHYELTDFEVREGEFELPATLLGTFRVTTRLFDTSNTEVWCQIMELEIVKK